MNIISETIGTNLKELRNIRNLSQDQVAAAIGVTRKALSAYENGNRKPSYEHLIGLAKYFHVTTDYLLGMQTGRAIDATGLDEGEYINIVELTERMREKNRRISGRFWLH